MQILKESLGTLVLVITEGACLLFVWYGILDIWLQTEILAGNIRRHEKYCFFKSSMEQITISFFAIVAGSVIMWAALKYIPHF